MAEIRLYQPELDEENLFGLMEEEGDEWQDYWDKQGWLKYQKALANSQVFVAYQNQTLCGFIRFKDDDGFGVYIHDLLVRKPARGQHLGRALMDAVCGHCPNDTVYVMSDVDAYYAKAGVTHREGSILTVQKQGITPHDRF